MIAYQQHAGRFRQRVKSARRVLLTVTHGIDGDSLGSLIAMGHILDQWKVEWFAYAPEDVPVMFTYITKKRFVMREMDAPLESFDVVIIFDTGDMKRTPLIRDIIRRTAAPFVINIDHHPTVTSFERLNAVDHNIVDTEAASTTEMIYHLLQHLDIRVTVPMATSLLTGLLTDTTHFANPATTPTAVDVAAKLMARGADHATITEATMRNKNMATLKLWGRALSRLAYNDQSGVVSTVITLQDLKECEADEDASTGIANFLTTLSDGKVALVLQEEPDGIVKGSFRTTSDIDVSALAEKFGGGGHRKAAGFKVRGKLVQSGLGWQVEKI